LDAGFADAEDYMLLAENRKKESPLGFPLKKTRCDAD
jgi:hypothetical protein